MVGLLCSRLQRYGVVVRELKTPLGVGLNHPAVLGRMAEEV